MKFSQEKIIGLVLACAGALIAIIGPSQVEGSNPQLIVSVLGVALGYFGFRKMQASAYRKNDD